MQAGGDDAEEEYKMKNVKCKMADERTGISSFGILHF